MKNAEVSGGGNLDFSEFIFPAKTGGIPEKKRRPEYNVFFSACRYEHKFFFQNVGNMSGIAAYHARNHQQHMPVWRTFVILF